MYNVVFHSTELSLPLADVDHDLFSVSIQVDYHLIWHYLFPLRLNGLTHLSPNFQGGMLNRILRLVTPGHRV